MKKIYNAPKLDVLNMDIEDAIIATSDPNALPVVPGEPAGAKERTFSSSSEDDEWLHFTPKFN